MTRAPETGSEPTCSKLSGTCANQPSSWSVRVRRRSEYQEPAWKARLEGMVSFERSVSEGCLAAEVCMSWSEEKRGRVSSWWSKSAGYRTLWPAVCRCFYSWMAQPTDLNSDQNSLEARFLTPIFKRLEYLHSRSIYGNIAWTTASVWGKFCMYSMSILLCSKGRALTTKSVVLPAKDKSTWEGRTLGRKLILNASSHLYLHDRARRCNHCYSSVHDWSISRITPGHVWKLISPISCKKPVIPGQRKIISKIQNLEIDWCCSQEKADKKSITGGHWIAIGRPAFAIRCLSWFKCCLLSSLLTGSNSKILALIPNQKWQQKFQCSSSAFPGVLSLVSWWVRAVGSPQQGLWCYPRVFMPTPMPRQRVSLGT